MAMIKLTHGLFSEIDDDDLHLVADKKWHASSRRDGKGFYAVSSNGTRMHRLLLGVCDDRVVDHKDGNGLNNKRENIRAGTQSQNCVNRLSTPGPHMRGARPKKGRWQAYIKYQGKQTSIGYFATEQEAHNAYLLEAKRLHGDWMPLPEPPEVDNNG